MTRFQILLDDKEIKALKREAAESGKSYSQLVREVIDSIYIPRFSETEIAKMANEAKSAKGLRNFKNLQAARGYLCSL
jgi:hypothetical protein